jgi:hypothetical protein
LLGVKVFHGDFPREHQPLPDATRRRLLPQGGNGSGKTIRMHSEAEGDIRSDESKLYRD